MGEFGNFGFGSNIDRMKLSKMLLQAKQVSSDITNIIPLSLDKELVSTNMHKKTALYDQLEKFTPPESTAYWPVETSDNFGKFTTEANGATAWAAQKGTYGSAGSVATKLMTYVLNIGLIAQKNAKGTLDLVRQEQQLGMLAMRKGIERCSVIGLPAAGGDGGPTDAQAFHGLKSLVTTNVDAPANAEAISLDKLDDVMDKCVNAGAAESDLILVTDIYTKTKIGSLFYNTYNTPIGNQTVNAGMKVESYRQAPIFVSDYTYSKTSGSRELYVVDTGSTKLAEFWSMSQLDLGRVQLSDDSIIFWMGALAVKKEDRNGIITKIV